jgi:hypothetical protein
VVGYNVQTAVDIKDLDTVNDFNQVAADRRAT